MKPLEDVKINDDWLKQEKLQKVLALLTADGAQTLVAGGAVRNALMGEAVSDVDLCTTLLPQEVEAIIAPTHMKTVPTGIEHGTVTIVADDDKFEVTTLREDIETDGRHAVVKFGKDWLSDAQRRDLTINALYCDREGNVYDPLEGYGDIKSREVRFIGEASQRIKEDALRILRFFRFFAHYGGGRPDAAGLKACSANKELIHSLSVERVWMELKKLLAAKDPGRALLWMRTTGILNLILPETQKWGIDTIPALIRLEAQQGWSADPMLRLMAIVRPHLDAVRPLAKRLAFSNIELERLEQWSKGDKPDNEMNLTQFSKMLYRGSPQGITDTMILEAAHIEPDDAQERLEQWLEFIAFAKDWQRPVMPVQGRDLIEAGMSAGPQLGKALSALEDAWIESGFSLDKQALLKL